MKFKSLFISFVFLLAISDIVLCADDENLLDEAENQTNSATFYTAGVVELNTVRKFSDPVTIVNENLQEYVQWIEKAANQGVDILVFPEATLNYNNIHSRSDLSEVAVDLQSLDIPDVNECFYSNDNIISEISFAAANSSIYVLVNVVEIENCSDKISSCSLDGFNLYNTNLVFDRNGCIISKYRKFNLFVEPLMNVTKEPEVAMFDTDFGVTFGHFICFDILFESPTQNLVRLNITHFLYPSMWYSETPFLTSLQTHQGFAMSNNVVLLSAGANSPSESNTGSGIFIGRHGAVQRIISCKNESKLLIAEVPIDVNDPEYQKPKLKPGYEPKEMDNLKLWNINDGKFIEFEIDELILDYEDISCKFTLNYTLLDVPVGQKGYAYKFAYKSGIRKFVDIVEAGEVFCAIVACTDERMSTSCGMKFNSSDNLVSTVKFHSIEVEMKIENFESENFMVMPTSLDFSILPLNSESFEYKSAENYFKIRLTSEVDDLMTFGVFGRNFKLDKKTSNYVDIEPKTRVDENNNENDDEAEVADLTIKMTIYVVLMVVLSIITSIMVYKKLQQPSFESEVSSNKRKN